MSQPVIKVESLSKRYRIGLKEKRKDTLFGQIGAALRAPINNFRQLRSLNNFNKDDESVFWALQDINFEVHQGEVLGIIGHNGAGKSTLLKILSRITEPTDGRITVKGRIGALLEVGTGFHPELTGRDNIYMNGTILGMTRKEIDSKLDEIMNFSGVEKYIDTPVKFYSSGMKVRLGFAVAAHLEPEILVIDEVLSVGDIDFQKKCIGKMRDIAGNGRTVLFVSHNMAAIQGFCDRTSVLRAGKLVYNGENDEAIKQYMNSFHNNSNNNIKNESKYINKLYITNENNEMIDSVLMGSSFTINAEVLGMSSTKDLHIGFFINDSNGTKVGAFSTAMKQPNSNKRSTNEVVSFLLKAPPLAANNYFIDFVIAYKHGHRLEYHTGALHFTVIPTDIYKSGINYNSHFGHIFFDIDFNYNPLYVS